MKSKIFRWYERHERAVNAVLEIACDTIPGASLVKGVVNLAQSVDLDTEEVQNDQRIRELENMLATIKPQIVDLLEEIEDLRNFKEAKTTEEIQKMIYENQHIVEELNEVLPAMSTSISKSINTFETLTESSEEKYETLLRGKYTLEHCLASGGQGTVYRGRNTVADRQVAIKLLPEEFTNNTHGVEVLKAEYRRLADKLTHPNIVQYRDLDFSEEKQQWFITMDYVDGYTLRKSIFEQQRRGFTPEQVHQYLFPIAQALEYAHKNEVVHCDLKPENIMIARDGNILLTDFGLSQEVQQSVISAATKHAKEIGGTLPYMAPEQYKGWGVTKHTDVWALGVIMYEMLAGRHPFQGTSYEHYKDIICNGQPRALDDNRMWYFVQQALYKNDKERVSSPVTLVAQLLQVEEINVESIGEIQEKKIQKNKHKKKLDKIDQGNELYKKAMEFRELKTPEGYREALQLLEKASEMGNIKAMYQIGKLYQDGLIELPNIHKAMSWYRRAAKENDVDAARSLGHIYYDEKNYKFAVEFLEQAIDKGDGDSMNTLGVMYEFGRGVDIDLMRAVELYNQAIDKGNKNALVNLGELYEEGKGLNKNVQKALELYQEAADSAHARGMSHLGYMYRCGKGVEQDYQKALELFRKAANEGDDMGIFNLGYMHEYGLGVEENYQRAAEFYKEAVNKGNHAALGSLGLFYAKGHGVNQDYKKAAEFYQQAVDKGVEWVFVSLGYLYNYGLGVKKDYKKAVEFYKKAANKNDPLGIGNLGYMYQNGLGVRKNLKKAVELFQQAADKGNDYALVNLAYLYEVGLGVKENKKKAVELYQKAADKNESQGYRNLGLMYQHGQGVKQDYKKAVELYQRAVDQGYIEAINDLGFMYRHGLGVKQDYRKAVELFQQAADKGNDCALVNLGELYENGLGVAQDLKKSIEIYKEAVNRGNGQGINNLGFMYQYAKGVSKDLQKAVELYEQAVEKGICDAMNNLGKMYETGKGVKKNYTKAAELYERSGNQGNLDGILKTAYMYYRGRGVDKNIDHALEWFDAAASLGSVEALKKILYICAFKGKEEYNEYAVVEKGKNAYESLKKMGEENISTYDKMLRAKLVVHDMVHDMLCICYSLESFFDKITGRSWKLSSYLITFGIAGFIIAQPFIDAHNVHVRYLMQEAYKAYRKNDTSKFERYKKKLNGYWVGKAEYVKKLENAAIGDSAVQKEIEKFYKKNSDMTLDLLEENIDDAFASIIKSSSGKKFSESSLYSSWISYREIAEKSDHKESGYYGRYEKSNLNALYNRFQILDDYNGGSYLTSLCLRRMIHSKFQEAIKSESEQSAFSQADAFISQHIESKADKYRDEKFFSLVMMKTIAEIAEDLPSSGLHRKLKSQFYSQLLSKYDKLYDDAYRYEETSRYIIEKSREMMDDISGSIRY